MSDIVEEVRKNAVVFGNEANLSRAFPSVYDGLKPSQRACLWAAFTNGYSSNKPHVKSAKLDGATIATLWPHGSVYETFARLSQNFIMNLPLIDFHGGNGSQLGSADVAASRYTEVRLSKASEDGYFTNIKKNTCKMIPNFSEDLEWPEYFPAIIPNLFINGSDGIGYCYSQTWQPGNLREFSAKVKDYLAGNFNCNDIFPDYPTRGIISNKSEIHKIYETGTGTVILRGKAEIDGNIIRITELPYQIYVSAYMEQLKKLCTADKNGNVKIDGVSDIFNMSDENGMLIEIETFSDPNVVLNSLYKYSDLQVSLSANQYALIDGIPEIVNLETYIRAYVDYNMSIIVKEFTFDKNKAEDRLEIVSGLLKAIGEIESIISVIKSSKKTSDAITGIISLGYTENQAKAITDMKLSKLSGLETKALDDESKQLNKTIKQCAKLLGSKKLQQEEFVRRLDEFTEKYGWDRRTEVIDSELAVDEVVKVKVPKSEKEYFVVFKNNHIKRVELSEYKNDKDAITVKCKASDKVTLISKSGMMYKLVCKQIGIGTNRSTGDDLKQILNADIVSIYGNVSDKYFVFVTKDGLVKKITKENVIDVSKNVGTVVMKLDVDDEIKNILTCNSKNIRISYNSGKKDKIVDINTDDLIAKGRTAGGVRKVKGTVTNCEIVNKWNNF